MNKNQGKSTYMYTYLLTYVSNLLSPSLSQTYPHVHTLTFKLCSTGCMAKSRTNWKCSVQVNCVTYRPIHSMSAQALAMTVQCSRSMRVEYRKKWRSSCRSKLQLLQSQSAEPQVELAMQSPMASILLVISSSLFASWKQGLGIEILVWICSSLPTETPSRAPPLLPRCFLYYGRSLMGSLLLFFPAQELPAYDRSPWCMMKDDDKGLVTLPDY